MKTINWIKIRKCIKIRLILCKTSKRCNWGPSYIWELFILRLSYLWKIHIIQIQQSVFDWNKAQTRYDTNIRPRYTVFTEKNYSPITVRSFIWGNMGIQRKGIPGLSADNRRCLVLHPLQGRSYHEAHRDSVHLIPSSKKSTTLNTEQVDDCRPEEPIHDCGVWTFVILMSKYLEYATQIHIFEMSD